MLPTLVTLVTLAALLTNRQPPVLTKPEVECQEKYCVEVFVDAPKNTLLKDQSQGAGLRAAPVASLRRVYETVKRDLHKETVLSPGLKMVAHAIA